jgi:hypothetical protein
MIAPEDMLEALFFFHKGKIEDIEESYSYAKDEFVENYRHFGYLGDIGKMINMIDVIEIFSDKAPLCNIRELLYDSYVIPKGWEWKSLSKDCWHKKYDDNTWIFDSWDGDRYVYIKNSASSVEKNKDGVLDIGDNESLLLYGSYYKYMESYYIGNESRSSTWLRMNLTNEMKIKTYTHKFERNCFMILHDEYDYESIKSINLLGLNTYMTDDEVSKEEALGRTATLSKSKVDKFFAAIKSVKTKKVTPKDITPTEGEAQ